MFYHYATVVCVCVCVGTLVHVQHVHVHLCVCLKRDLNIYNKQKTEVTAMSQISVVRNFQSIASTLTENGIQILSRRAVQLKSLADDQARKVKADDGCFTKEGFVNHG